MEDDQDSPQKRKEAEMLALKKKIIDVFQLFDYEANNTVDMRELGTIIRALGCFPSEAEVQEILTEVQDPDTAIGYISLDFFLPVMIQIINDGRFKCASDEELLRAFQVLDKDHKGYLLKEEVTKFMTEEGEKFNQEEIEEMMNTAVDAGTGHIQYRKYLFKFSPEDD